jgi:surfeit locus 1 family protein
MRVRVGAGVFTPRFWPTLITALFLPVLIGLGGWQVHRLHWKRELIATISERVHQAPVGIPLAGQDADYRPAKASGVFRHDLELFVFSTSLASGQGGYRVLTPLQLADGRFLLVDRGWIPFDRKRTDGFSHPEGAVEVRGILRIPPAPNWIQPKNNPAKGEWYNADLAAMAAADKLTGFLPYVLEADATANPGGYPVGGQTRLTLPNDHFSYAVTWYSLAAILVIIYGLSCARKNSED